MLFIFSFVVSATAVFATSPTLLECAQRLELDPAVLTAARDTLTQKQSDPEMVKMLRAHANVLIQRDGITAVSRELFELARALEPKKVMGWATRLEIDPQPVEYDYTATEHSPYRKITVWTGRRILELNGRAVETLTAVELVAEFDPGDERIGQGDAYYAVSDDKDENRTEKKRYMFERRCRELMMELERTSVHLRGSGFAKAGAVTSDADGVFVLAGLAATGDGELNLNVLTPKEVALLFNHVWHRNAKRMFDVQMAIGTGR